MKQTYLKPELNSEIIEMEERVLSVVSETEQIEIPGGQEGTLDIRLLTDPTNFDVVDALGF